jgi:4-amino-4-deoxy-L-arabinose transferase-like glycosyltransferase
MTRGRSIAVIGFTALWFGMLFGRPLYDPDEGRYAEIPREMLSGGDWLIPHLNGFVYLEKPPLQYWITAASFRLFGQSEASARLWTGLCGYLTLVVVWALGRRLWGAEAGDKALLLIGGSILFVLLGHQLTLDMSLCFLLTCSLATFILAQMERLRPRIGGAWMLGCWLSMALAVLTKGLIGVLIPGFTLAAYVLWQRDWRALKHLNLLFGLPLFAAVAAPWFVLATRANPAFFQFFFIREHFQRYLTPIEERGEPWWFFIPVVLVGVLPWSTQAMRALATGWRTVVPAGRFDAARVRWIWSVFVLVFFSISHSKLIPYVLPMLPALALLCADPRFGAGRRHLSAGAALSAAFGAGIVVYAAALWGSPGARALAAALRPALGVTAAALVLGAVACQWCVRRRQPGAALAMLSLAWIGAAVGITFGAFGVQQNFSARDIAVALRREPAPGAPVFSVQNYQQSLPFYWGQAIILVDYRDEFALGQRQDPGAWVPTMSEFNSRWRVLDDAYAVLPQATRDRLRAEELPMREIACFASRLCLVARR